MITNFIKYFDSTVIRVRKKILFDKENNLFYNNLESNSSKKSVIERERAKIYQTSSGTHRRLREIPSQSRHTVKYDGVPGQ